MSFEDTNAALPHDAEFTRIMRDLINEAMMEAGITDSTIESPAIDDLIQVTLKQGFAAAEADMRRRFPNEAIHPDAFRDEVMFMLMKVMFDHGFRVGRLFEARGYEIDL